MEATRDRCRDLLAEAVAEADSICEAARAEGETAGREAGLRDAAGQIERAAREEADRLAGDRLAAALPPLEALAAAFEAEQRAWRAAWEPAAVRLARDLAARLLGRELAANPAAVGELAGEALAAAAGSPAAAVTVSPDALAAMGDDFAQRVAAGAGAGGDGLRGQIPRPRRLRRAHRTGRDRRPAGPRGSTGSPPNCCPRGTTNDRRPSPRLPRAVGPDGLRRADRPRGPAGPGPAPRPPGCPRRSGRRCGSAPAAGPPVDGVVTGFAGGETFVMPYGDLWAACGAGTRWRLVRSGGEIAVGPGLLGRVLDGRGRLIDGRPAPPRPHRRDPSLAAPPPALGRAPIRTTFGTGVKVVDALLTCGVGQRVGLFAGSGVGKSTLLGQLARGSDADVNVLALVGERGREVREFLDRDLGPAGRKKSVVVVATGDEPAAVRLRAALTATAIAEHFT